MKKLSIADKYFLGPAVNAYHEGRGALYWGSDDIRRARRLEKRGLVTVEETGEVVAGEKEVLVTLNDDGFRARGAA